MKLMNERRRRRIEKNILKDRRYKTLIYNRVILTVALVLVQIVLYGFLMASFYTAGRAVLFAVNILGILFVLYIINRNEKPSAKLNWVIMILILPICGISLYLLFGEGRPTRRMNRRISAAKRENAGVLVQDAEVKAFVDGGGRNTETCRYLMNYANYPAYGEGDVTYYPSGKEMFKDMLEALESAKKFILAEYFIISGGKMWDTFRELLLKKANEGVEIKLIFDDVGSLLLLPPKYDKYLESLHPNIKCFRFNPAVPVFTMRMNNRDHRKILVVDGKTAFTGGINLADEYIDEKVKYGKWKDTGVRVTGQAVSSFTMMFFNIWNAFRKDKGALRNYIAPEYLERESELEPVGSVGKNGTEIPVEVRAGRSTEPTDGNDKDGAFAETAKERFGKCLSSGVTGESGAVRAFEKAADGSRREKDFQNASQKGGLIIQPYDDSPLDRESVGETVYLELINRAYKYLYIFTPYLVLDDFMRTALCNAAKRGVDVRIVTPGIPDKKTVFRLTRANYGPLLKAGVRIYEYTPGFIHAKSMVCDDETAVVGTINLDYRSLYLHFENAVYFSHCPAVGVLKADCLSVFKESKKISLEDTRQTFIGRLFDSVLRVFETLL